MEEIKSEDLVIGDSLMVEEGTSNPSDALIVHSNDFSVNESSTGPIILSYLLN